MSSDAKDLNVPEGAPCWMDLLTTDVDKSTAFFGELFGWETHDTAPEMGGYKYFTKDGKAVGGVMLNDPQWQAPNSWSIHLRSSDVAATAAAAKAHGGRVAMEPMQVGENGSFTVIIDAGEASISVWQPGTESGFGVIMEEGTPFHFELHTRDYDKAVQFYKDVFKWQPVTAADEPHFRYTTFAEGEPARAGIMDASQWLPEGVPAHWSVYIQIADVDKALEQVVALGGSVIMAPEDTPYGRLATAADPVGSVFKLHS